MAFENQIIPDAQIPQAPQSGLGGFDLISQILANTGPHQLVAPPAQPMPALPDMSSALVNQQVDERTQGLSDLLAAAQQSAVPVEKPRMIDNIIRAIAQAASVGTSNNPSNALAQQLIQQQARAERERQIKQEQADKELRAKEALILGKQKAQSDIRGEIRADQKELRQQNFELSKQLNDQIFRTALQDSENKSRAAEAQASRDLQARLAGLREENDLGVASATNFVHFNDIGVNGLVNQSISYKIPRKIPLTQAESDELARAYLVNEQHKLQRSLTARAPAPRLLSPKDFLDLGTTIQSQEKNTLVPAVYGDEGFPPDNIDPRTQQPMRDAKGALVQTAAMKGAPVVDLFGKPQLRKQTQDEALSKARAQQEATEIMAYISGSMTPEAKAAFERKLGPRVVSAGKLASEIQEPAFRIINALNKNSSPVAIQHWRKSIANTDTLSEPAKKALMDWFEKAYGTQ